MINTQGSSLIKYFTTIYALETVCILYLNGGTITHFLPSLHSVTVCCQLEIGHGSSIYTVENGKHYNQTKAYFFLLESWLLNIWQHTGDTPLLRQRQLFVDDLASRKHSCTGNIENCYNTELQLSHASRYVIKAQLYTETRTNHEKKQ